MVLPDLEYKNRKAWYKISNGALGLELLVHIDLWSIMQKKVTLETPFVQTATSNSPGINFIPPKEGDWGFDSKIRYQGESDGMVVFSIPIPSGEEEKYDPSEIHNVSASLGIFTQALSLVRKEDNYTNTGRKQLLDISCSIDRVGNASFCAIISPAARPLIRQALSLDGQELVQRSMMTTYAKILGLADCSDSWFPVGLDEKGRLRLTVGDADLYPDSGEHDDELGYRLVSHGLETAWQQLTFAAGMAEISDLCCKLM